MIKILIKNRLRALFGSMVGKGKGGEVKKASVGKIVGFAILYAYLALVFIGLAVGAAVIFASAFLGEGGDWIYFAIFSLASLTVVFVLSIFETKSELFECKDNDLLLSMPIKPRDIVVSRIVVVLIYNYFTAAIVMLPAVVVYAIFTLNPLGIIGGLLVSLLIPLLGTAFASAVGYLLALICRKIKNKTFITVALALAFLGAYFWAYTSLLDNMDAIIGNLAEALPELEGSVLYFIGNASLLSPVPFLTALLVSFAAAFVAYALISHSYIKLITETSGASSRAYKAERLKSGSALSALVKKELRHLLSNANYILNSCLGIIFMLVAAVVAVLKRAELAMIGEELFGTSAALVGIIAAGLTIMSSMCMMSACSLSLEGKRLWILKSIPVAARTAVLSKALPQAALMLPVSIVSAIVVTFATAAPFYYYPIAIIAVSAASIGFSFLGTIINVLFPKFEFENEVQPIKQSLSVFLTMVINMVVSLAVIFVSIILAFISPLISVLCVTLIFVIFAVVSALILLGPIAKRYESL